MTTDLRDALHDTLDRLPVPPGDLDRVRAAGTTVRRRRRAAGAVGVLAIGAVVAGFALGGPDGTSSGRGVDPIGQLDYSEGLRAYADPGHEIHLGGRTFPADRLDDLDTDAAATPYGVVFYADGRPMLLAESGEIADLEPAAATSDFHPTAKADSQAPLVAYGAALDGATQVVVRNLATDEVVAQQEVPEDAVIDAFDGGVVFLRVGDVTSTWDTVTGEQAELAGPETRVADVRNGAVLYDGPEPDGPAAAHYFLVPGAIDAQLTHDGQHVLYWSSRLEPTDGGRPIVLDQKALFFAVDTDGSILAATNSDPTRVYDCEVPSGRCTLLGELSALGGDPVFIGTDM